MVLQGKMFFIFLSPYTAFNVFKQSHRGALIQRSSENMEQVYWRHPRGIITLEMHKGALLFQP